MTRGEAEKIIHKEYPYWVLKGLSEKQVVAIAIDIKHRSNKQQPVVNNQDSDEESEYNGLTISSEGMHYDNAGELVD